jgi:uncharacterized protein YkwD
LKGVVMVRLLSVPLGLCVALSGCIVVPVPVPAGLSRPLDLSSPPNACPVSTETTEAGAPGLAALNDARAAAGLPPLSLAPRLTRVAQDHSCDQAVSLKMGHVGSDGADLRKRLDRGGVSGNAWAENVGMGQRTVQEMVAGWIASPGHRANILNPRYGAIGLAVSRDVAGQPYWTLVLADRP